MRPVGFEGTWKVRALAVAAAAVAGLATIAAQAPAQQPIQRLDAAALRTAIDRALNVAPRGLQALQPPAQTGVRLLTVDVDSLPAAPQRVTLDMSQRVLTYEPRGSVDAILDHIIAATAPLTAGANAVEYRFLVDGVPLDQFLSRLTVPDPPRSRAQQDAASGPIVVSAGHGWYYHELSGEWRLQRDYFWGIVEDFVNHDMATYLERELRAAGFDVRPARQPDRGAGTGVSGRARWEESAKYYIRDLGAPGQVWDFGVDDYAKDINSRPFYANWVGAATIVSIHNNGGGGSGTETWYDATNGHAHESQRLAAIVNRRIVDALRARFDPNWPDRGLRTCNGCKGETRLAGRPAILVEAAFMDTRSPDNDALHSEPFKQIVAQAIREGLEEWGLAPPPFLDEGAARARHDMIARASQDQRFVAIVDGSFGSDLHTDASWEMRWLDAAFTGGRQVRLWHMASRRNPGERYVGYRDPDTSMWTGWQQVE